MKSFKEFFYDRIAEEKANQFLNEWNCFSLIPGTKNSYTEHPANTSTLTQKHAHVYAKPKGGGKQLYAVNLDGTGHDGSSGTLLSDKHAAYFRSLGYTLPENNILETVSLSQLDSDDFTLIISFTEDQERQLLLE